MKSLVVLFGKPNAGKGTWLDEFKKGRENQLEVLSVSAKLKAARAERTELGLKAASYMDSGALVPDELVNGIVIDGIKQSTKVVIADGFPRTVGQAEALLAAGVVPDMVIEFNVDDEEIIRRASTRLACKCGATFSTTAFRHPKVEGICDNCGGKLFRRKDDEPEVVRNRLKVYQQETAPVMDVLIKAGVKVYDKEHASEKILELLTD